ncbi:Fic family protein [bacterium]|nr:Fic family protein [bacterium]
MLQELDALKIQWAALLPLEPEVAQRMDRMLEYRFIAASNAVEDKHALSYDETEVFLEKGLTSAGRKIEDFLALERHRNALAEARSKARADVPLTLDLIRGLHNELTRDLKDKDYSPGQWKTKANRATTRRGRAFRYAAPEAVPGLMRDLVAGYEGLAPRVHQLEAIGWLAYHFHLIHPFNEANGRLQRLVTTFLLMKSGYRELVIDPRERGAYLDALAACDSTVPPDKLQALYSGIETARLVDFFAERQVAVLDELLGIIEGRQVRTTKDVAEGSRRGQTQVLTRLREASPDLVWRHEAAQQVRRFHERINTALQAARDDQAPFYAIETESGSLKQEHSVERLVRASLPTGGAGLVGEAVLALRPKTTAAVKMPAARALVVAVAASRVGLHVVSRWENEVKPVVRAGPPNASQWSQASLERHLAERIEAGRRAYDSEIVEMNRAKDMKTVLRGIARPKPKKVVAESEARPTSRRSPRIADPAQSGPVRLPPRRILYEDGGGKGGKLGGIRPSEPPLSM